ATSFFFSSRRRHTRWPRDWSSDVCSSDLVVNRSAADLLHDARSRERAACIPEAVQLYEGAISTAERSGEKAILAEALRRLAVVVHHRNESARARDLCDRSYKLACALGNDVLAAEALNTMGGLALRTGAVEEA